MPHQCVRCSKIIEAGSRELLEGCNNCNGKFFFFIRDEQVEKIKESMGKPLEGLSREDSDRIERDVREILKVEDEDTPVILDVESIRVVDKGKFELDLVSLMNRRPIVFKLQEGKYYIDIGSM